jgi:hypothetical protein
MGIVPLYEVIVPISFENIEIMESKTDKNSRVIEADTHIEIPFFMDKFDLKNSRFYKVALLDIDNVHIKDLNKIKNYINAKSIYFLKPDSDVLTLTDKVFMKKGEINA